MGRGRERLMVVGLAALVAVVALFGASDLEHRSGDQPTPRPAAVIAAVSGPATAVVAERLPDPPRSGPLLALAVAVIALAGLAALPAAPLAVDRRALAAIEGLRGRRRAPPAPFTF